MNRAGFRPEVERALRFIAENLEQPLTLEEVAGAAHLSAFHFHRIFHAEIGEPLGRFITRRRLEVSALRLAYEPDRSVTDIALSSGYSSSSNFTKAFTAFFGVSPTQLRDARERPPDAIGRLTSEYGKDFHPRDLYTLPAGIDEARRGRRAADWNERVRFVTTEGVDLACLASTGAYSPEAIAETWTRLIPMARALGFAETEVDAWGMLLDSPQVTSPELCRYHACIPCPSDRALAPPLFRGRLTEGRYAVFLYSGEVTGVEAAYLSIYSCWFAQSSVAPDDFVPFDHYISDEPRDGRVELEMWFKIRPRR